VSAGDNDAFRYIVEQCSTRLVRLGARMLGSVADAEDLIQEAFLRAHRALVDGRYDGRASVDTWLYRIVTNQALDQLRARKRRGKPVEPTDEMMVEDGNTPETRIALKELDDWMSELAAEQRVALVLSALEGLSNAEIAGLMNCSEGSVEQRLVRARAALRQKRSVEYAQHG
jgi:RNA polymerase sigma-70 factor (ECF subfamily)